MTPQRLLPGFLALVALLVSGCGNTDNAAALSETERALPIRALPVAARTFEQRLTVQGTLEAKHFAHVAARISGNLDHIWVDEGDAVIAGETALFQVDPTSRENALIISQQDLAVAQASLAVAQASSQKMQAEARKATLDFERFERLYNDDKVSQSEFESAEVAAAQAKAGIAVANAQVDLAERQVKQAEAALSIAEKDLADTQVVAPITGVVSARQAEPGEQMSVGRVILRIDDLSTVEAAAFLPAHYYARVIPGQTQFRLGIGGEPVGEYRITTRSPVINPILRTFEIKGRLDKRNDQVVPGQMADLTLVFESREGLGVPSVAILVRVDRQVVFVVQEGRAVAREVTTGLQNDAWTEILSGLDVGEKVIIEGQTQLHDGMAIEVLSSPEKAPPIHTEQQS
ncbi:MAG: efflux RND transporter periplasmic adaptor subunit [Kiritimatiellae bacterium]|nr:efflux RND transporter periplasmic adaptor subunit [Kiritimatiellia bacterium]